MAKPSYWEMLRDPRWQQKRLKVMERDKWTCRDCGNKAGTFNVHHCYYVRGNAPWDYPDESLVTLCEKCHERRTDGKQALDRLIGRFDRNNYLVVEAFVIGIYAMLNDAGAISEAIQADQWYAEDYLTDVLILGMLVLPAEFGSEVAAIKKAVYTDGANTACTEDFMKAVENRFWPDDEVL